MDRPMPDAVVTKRMWHFLAAVMVAGATLVLRFGPRVFDPQRSSRGDLILVILVLALALGTALALAVSLLVRNRRLHQELLAATQRRIQVEELTLAAAGLAHETKNPLGIIRGLAQQIAADDADDTDARQKAEQIMEEADVTTARLGDFIRYAKMREPEFSEVNALPYLTEICELVRRDFESNGVTFELDLSDLRIIADREMLSQILLNLLNNCLKATESGSRVLIELQRERGNTACLTVSDTGLGISKDFLPFVFKPYMSRSRGGYGLGLAIVKRIVERSGWDISLESEEGKGTAIRITGVRVVA